MVKRAELIKINDAITLINDANESTYYLVCGSKKALMIDTGFGYDNVMEVASDITDLPIEVVNTHGHCDHVYGNIFCKEAFMHPNDFTICEQHFQLIKNNKLYSKTTCCPLIPIDQGQVFDLGDLKLEVVELMGHTPGSIGLLDKKHRILFSGDSLNSTIWLQLNECLPLSQFRKNISEMMLRYQEEFDYYLSGHTKELLPKQAISELLKGCDEIIEGNNQQDIDYQWFGGIHKGHPYGDGVGKLICYNEANIY